MVQSSEDRHVSSPSIVFTCSETAFLVKEDMPLNYWVWLAVLCSCFPCMLSLFVCNKWINGSQSLLACPVLLYASCAACVMMQGNKICFSYTLHIYSWQKMSIAQRGFNYHQVTAWQSRVGVALHERLFKDTHARYFKKRSLILNQV